MSPPSGCTCPSASWNSQGPEGASGNDRARMTCDSRGHCGVFPRNSSVENTAPCPVELASPEWMSPPLSGELRARDVLTLGALRNPERHLLRLGHPREWALTRRSARYRHRSAFFAASGPRKKVQILPKRGRVSAKAALNPGWCGREGAAAGQLRRAGSVVAGGSVPRGGSGLRGLEGCSEGSFRVRRERHEHHGLHRRVPVSYTHLTLPTKRIV